MGGKKRDRENQQEPVRSKGKRKLNTDTPIDKITRIEQYVGHADPRTRHPRDIDQPTDHNFNIKDLGEKKEGENFDRFAVTDALRGRGGATCRSVLVMKHHKPLPMWFDRFLCPRVMPGKWCGYVAYAFRRRIRFGSWPTWRDVPKDVKEEAWLDVLESWDFRTVLTKQEHAQLKKLWTTYASHSMRSWRTNVWKRYVDDPEEGVELGHPCLKYKWMDPKEWDLFVTYRSTNEEFKRLSIKNSANAKLKKYHHHTGSAGYRIIYIKKAKEMREAAILKKIDEGMTREEAEEMMIDMVFRVDRSIVFLEANKWKDTKTYSDAFVIKVAAEILRLNKEKDEGRLIIEGKDDILYLATKEREKPGRYRGCPTTAKLNFAFPEHCEAKAQKNKASRRRKQHQDSCDEEEADVLSKLEQFRVWLEEKCSIQIPNDVTPEQFMNELKIRSQPSTSYEHAFPETGAPDGDGEESDDEDPIPCFLQIAHEPGELVSVAGGLLQPSAAAPVGFKVVQVRPPIFLPNALLPCPHSVYDNVSSALGVPILWPEPWIDYTYNGKPQESNDKSDSEATLESKSRSTSPSQEDDVSQHLSSEGQISETEVVDQEAKPVVPSPDKVLLPESDPDQSHLTWNFAHHTRAPQGRKELAAFLLECKDHPNSQDFYSIPVIDEIFGSKIKETSLCLKEAMKWIHTIERRRKEWIHGWQMDLWASLLINEKANKEDGARIQIISTSATFSDQTLVEDGYKNVVNNVMELMAERKSTLYAMPFCKNLHWMLLILFPEESAVYCIDPNSIGITEKGTPFHYELLMRIGSKYDELFRGIQPAVPRVNSWSIVNINHKHQPMNWECGYYTMLYLEKLVLLYKGVDIRRVFPEDYEAYPISVIEGMIDTTCFYFVDNIAPVIREIHRGKRLRRNASTTSKPHDVLNV